MRILFMGTPEFAVPSLQALHRAAHELVGVVTRPPKPAGRGLKPRPSPVAVAAGLAGLPLLEPIRLKGFEGVVKSLRAELVVVVAYGRILRRPMLDAAPRGVVNVHASLLPRWRGAAPVTHALLAGDRMSGVSIMQLDEGMDTGPVYLTREEPVRVDDTTGSLSARLSVLGANLLLEALTGIEAGRLTAVAQPAAGVTMAPLLKAEHGRIEWAAAAEAIERRVRAMQPWPVAFTTIGGKRLRIHQAQLVRHPQSPGEPTQAEQGLVLETGPQGFVVGCGRGRLLVTRAQVEGRAACSARDLVNGRQVRSGDRLGA
jgi:methionyl-tRNA formyltransferase